MSDGQIFKIALESDEPEIVDAMTKLRTAIRRIHRNVSRESRHFYCGYFGHGENHDLYRYSAGTRVEAGWHIINYVAGKGVIAPGGNKITFCLFCSKMLRSRDKEHPEYQSEITGWRSGTAGVAAGD